MAIMNWKKSFPNKQTPFFTSSHLGLIEKSLKTTDFFSSLLNTENLFLILQMNFYITKKIYHYLNLRFYLSI